MTTYNPMGIAPLPFSASGDLSSDQYKFVMPGTVAKRVLLANGASGPVPFGVLQNDPVSGEAAQVAMYGTTQVWFSGSVDVTYGDFLIAGSAGGAELAALSAINAVALEGITAGSGYIEVFLIPINTNVWADQTP